MKLVRQKSTSISSGGLQRLVRGSGRIERSHAAVEEGALVGDEPSAEHIGLEEDDLRQSISAVRHEAPMRVDHRVGPLLVAIQSREASYYDGIRINVFDARLIDSLHSSRHTTASDSTSIGPPSSGRSNFPET